MTYNQILKKVKTRSIELGFSRYQLSKITGLTESSLSLIWSGKRNMKLESLILICDALNLKINLEEFKT